MTDKEIINAKNSFYKWEDKKFPEGNSPYSDDDVDIWVTGYLEAKKTTAIQSAILGAILEEKSDA